jgi:iron-sulfur cluster assembly protein
MAFEIITLTKSAAKRIGEIIAADESGAIGVRVGIKDAGCVGVSYTIDKVIEPNKGDDHISAHGVEVYIDPTATMFILGTEMDFETSKMSSGFTFKNPNQSDECGCGQSVQLKAVDLEELAKARSS